MTSREFAYWLQGYFEIRTNKNATLDETQVRIIQQHLAMVFIHEIDPSAPAEQQDALNAAHFPQSIVDLVKSDTAMIPRC